METADIWPETVLLLIESDGRCLGAARIDGDEISVVLSTEANGMGPALQRSIDAVSAPAAIPMPHRVLFAPGETIFSALDPADSLMSVRAGAVWFCGSALGAGERLGESAVVPGGRRFADAAAGSEGAEVCAIPAPKLQALMEDEPMLRIQLGMALSVRMAGLIVDGVRAKMSA